MSQFIGELKVSEEFEPHYYVAYNKDTRLYFVTRDSDAYMAEGPMSMSDAHSLCYKYNSSI